LSSRLKDSTDEAVLMLTGNVFHAEGPATVKDSKGKLFTHIASPVSQLQETGVQKGVFGA